MGPCSRAQLRTRQGRREYFAVASSSTTNCLQDIQGTIVLAGAGKMGGAMLTGWLAQGLDARRVVVIEPQPASEISALTARGIRLNPSPKEIGDTATLVVALKPQTFREAGATLKSFAAPTTLIVSIMAGGGGAAGREGDGGRGGGASARDAQHAGGDRPRHHRGGGGEKRQRRAARDRGCAVARHRVGRMGR